MGVAKRILLYLGLNILIVMTISLLLAVFHVQPYLTRYGLSVPDLAIFSLVWGMSAALIQLGLSRAMAKWVYGVKLIDTGHCSQQERELVDMVHDLCRRAGLSVMPEVGIYQSSEANAFATGPTRSRALVAVSSGLFKLMDQDEMRGVLGHEISHVTNGDMVTMTLLTGVVNAFVMFLSRLIAYAMARGSRNSQGTYILVQMLLQFVFLILGSMLIAAYSRHRECRADDGGAHLAGREKMIKALEALQRTYDRVDVGSQPALQAMKMSCKPQGIFRLFSTHPPLEDRIARLKQEG